MSSKTIDFHLPDGIKDFVFDLHEASRRSLRLEDVEPLYDVKFREITEKYFATSAWPNPSDIESECGNDAVFLLFYRYFFACLLFSINLVFDVL